MEERNYGLDVFRILCCIGVLIYHTIDDVLGVKAGTYVLYYGSSYCVPGFFLLSGYFIAQKNKCELNYYENKIGIIAYKLFGWVIFWSVIHFIRTSEIIDIWNNYLSGACEGGILPVAWYLFIYMLLLMASYPLVYAHMKNKCFFSIISICYMILICAGFGKNIVNSRPQALWIHLYLGYFVLGIVLNNLNVKTEKNRYYLVLGCGIVFILCSIYYSTCYQICAPNQHYGSWYYTLWLISLFIICSKIKMRNVVVCKAMKRISDNTFTVYLAHLPILLYLTGIKPIQNIHDALLMVIFLFVSANIMAECFRRIPMLRKIV